MSTTDSPHPVDAGELLAADHRQIEEYFARLEAADGGGGADRSHLLGQLIHDLSVH